jgi:hypothetical protein
LIPLLAFPPKRWIGLLGRTLRRDDQDLPFLLYFYDSLPVLFLLFSSTIYLEEGLGWFVALGSLFQMDTTAFSFCAGVVCRFARFLGGFTIGMSYATLGFG